MTARLDPDHPFGLLPIHILLPVMAALWLALNLTSLTRFPLPFCDEAWYASTAYQFLQHGNFGLPIVNNMYGLGEIHPVFGRMYLTALAGAFAVAGPGLLQARLVSLLGMAVTIAATYLSGARLYNRGVGLIAACLVAFAWDVMARGHIARPEIWVAAWIMGSLWLLWWMLEHPTPGRGLVFGLGAALSLNLHPSAMLFLAGFGVVCLVETGLRQHQWGALIGAGIGAALGGIVWLLLSGAGFLSAFDSGGWLSRGQSPLRSSAGDLVRAQSGWLAENYWRAYGGAARLQAIVFVSALGLAIWQRGRANTTLLILIAVSMVGYTLTKVGKLPSSSVLWVPPLLLLTAGNLAVMGNWLAAALPPLGRLPSAWLAMPLLTAYLAGDAWLAYRFYGADFIQDSAAIRDYLSPGQTVVGDATLWFVLADQDVTLVSDEYFFMSGVAPQDVPASLNAISPHLAAVDRWAGCTVVDRPEHQAYRAAIEQNCLEIDRWTTMDYAGPQETILYTCEHDRP